MRNVRRFLNKEVLIFLSLLIIAFLYYGNTLNVKFRWDDQFQIVHPFLIHSWKYIPLIFLAGIHHTGNNISMDFYYKPILFVSYCILYILGHGNPFPFHLFQLILHVCNTYLLYSLFKRFIDERLSYFLVAIFLIHPISQEVVVYNANLQEVLFFFFGLSGFLIATYTSVANTRYLVLSFVLFLLALLSKETAIGFVILLFLYGLLFSRENITQYTKTIISVCAFYFAVRMLGTFYFFIEMKTVTLSVVNHLKSIPILSINYVREMFLPSNSVTYPTLAVPALSVPDVLITMLLLIALAVLFFIIIFRFLPKGVERNRAVFFASWLLIGITIHLQIIPLDQYYAKRWLYFPLVGFLGVVGVIIQRYYSYTFLRWLLLILGFILLIYFSYQTMQLNRYWSDDRLLLQHLSRL